MNALLQNTRIEGQPDDPGIACNLLTFREGASGRTLIFMGAQEIGDITLSSWLRVRTFIVTIYLGTHRRRITASTHDQAKVFATQDVFEFFAATPVKLEAR